MITKLFVIKNKLFNTITSEDCPGYITLEPVVFCYKISHETITMNDVSIDNYYLTVIVSNSTPYLYYAIYKKMSEYNFPFVFIVAHDYVIGILLF